MKHLQPPWFAMKTNGHVIIHHEETRKHVCTMEAWPEQTDNAEVIIDSVNNYPRVLKALADLVKVVEEVEDIEHDFFGCPDVETCALCTAKNLVEETKEDKPEVTKWLSGMYK